MHFTPPPIILQAPCINIMNILMGEIEDIVKKEKHKRPLPRKHDVALITIETM